MPDEGAWHASKSAPWVEWFGNFYYVDDGLPESGIPMVLIPFDEGEDEAAAKDLADRIAKLLNGGS